MPSYRQAFGAFVVEVMCNPRRGTSSARRLDPEGADPVWTHVLQATPRSGEHQAHPPVFDVDAGTVVLHVESHGASGHEDYEDTFERVRAADGAVLEHWVR